jgi:C1A family cysteine protease
MPDRALDYTAQNGVPLGKDYPYTGRDGQCKTFNSAFKNGGH